MSSRCKCLYPSTDDGFTAAWILSKLELGDIEFVGLGPSPVPFPDRLLADSASKQTDLVLIKTVYGIETMRTLVVMFRSVLVVHMHELDPHLQEMHPIMMNDPDIPSDVTTVIEHFEKPAFRIYLSRNFCVSVSVHHLVYPRTTIPAWIHLIDSQVMAYDNPLKKAFTAGLRTLKRDFAVWDKLDLAAVLDAGQEALEKEARALAALKQERCTIEGYPCVMAEAESPVICNEFALMVFAQTDVPIAGVYVRTPEGGYSFSLRAKDAVDVGAIARKYGGNGQTKAAGFLAQTKDQVVVFTQ